MATHRQVGAQTTPRVKYVFVPRDDDEQFPSRPLSASQTAAQRKFADEVSWKQRVRDLGYATLGIVAAVFLILGGRVADAALQWHPGEHPEVTTATVPVPVPVPANGPVTAFTVNSP
jgi:hypothetical protein